MQRERADVAQLVEQLIRNQQVIGSSPIVGSIRHSPTAILLPPSDTPSASAELPEGYGLPRRSELQALQNSCAMSAALAAEGYRLPAARKCCNPQSL